MLVYWLGNYWFPFLVLGKLLEVYGDYVGGVREQGERCGQFFGGFPREDVGVQEDFLAELGLALSYHCWDCQSLHLWCFLVQKLVYQSHFVEIPKVLIVKSRHTLIFMFENTEKSSFSISYNTKLSNNYSVCVEPVPV